MDQDLCSVREEHKSQRRQEERKKKSRRCACLCFRSRDLNSSRKTPRMETHVRLNNSNSSMSFSARELFLSKCFAFVWVGLLILFWEEPMRWWRDKRQQQQGGERVVRLLASFGCGRASSRFRHQPRKLITNFFLIWQIWIIRKNRVKMCHF